MDFHMSEDEFRQYLNKVVKTLDLELTTISHEFGISIPTVERWLDGRTGPHPTMRSLVVTYLDRLLCRGK